MAGGDHPRGAGVSVTRARVSGRVSVVTAVRVTVTSGAGDRVHVAVLHGATPAGRVVALTW